MAANLSVTAGNTNEKSAGGQAPTDGIGASETHVNED